MGFSESFFAARFGVSRGDLESYLAEALSQGGDYADLYFEYLSTSPISIDESIVKSATQGVSLGVGVRVIAGERTGYAYSDDLSPEKIRKAARVAACIAAGPAKVEKTRLEEGQRHNLYPMLTAPTETGLRRARGSGEARRRAPPRLRSAHLPGAGQLCRQPAPGDGRDQRRRAQLRSPAAGAPERLGAGARRMADAPQRGYAGRRRARGAGFLPARRRRRSTSPTKPRAKPSCSWTRWTRRPAR